LLLAFHVLGTGKIGTINGSSEVSLIFTTPQKIVVVHARRMEIVLIKGLREQILEIPSSQFFSPRPPCQRPSRQVFFSGYAINGKTTFRLYAIPLIKSKKKPCIFTVSPFSR